MAAVHSAPTERTRRRPLAEHVRDASIHVTVNPVIDALKDVVNRLETDSPLLRMMRERFSFVAPGQRLICVTGHLREKLGDSFERICSTARVLSERGDAQIACLLHLNPSVHEPMGSVL
jgi:UDP-N-acetylglucosamine 2-epimerase (non-hydrolysing)